MKRCTNASVSSLFIFNRAPLTRAPSASESVIACVTMYSALNCGRDLAFSHSYQRGHTEVAGSGGHLEKQQKPQEEVFDDGAQAV